MNRLSTFISAAVAGVAFAFPVLAEDLAVILSNLNHRSQPDLASGPAADRMERALQNAGFSTVTLQNQRRAQMVARLNELGSRIAAADRLVIIANGHLVHTPRDTWLLAPDAMRPNGFDVGSMATPLGPLMDAAATKPGAAVFVMVGQPRPANLRAGVRAGPGPFDAPQGVTVVKGRAVHIARFFDDGLLIPGLSISSAAKRHTRVSVTGFVPMMQSFLPAASVMAAPTEPAEPEKSPEEIMAEIEADLRLSRSDRRRVQQNLAILGFDPRGIDGMLGRGSRRALRMWQADNNLEPTSFLNREQLTLLLDQGATRAAQLEEEARARQAQADARDTSYWRDTGSGDDETGMRAYLSRYPDGLFADIARERIAALEAERRPEVPQQELDDWDRVTAADTAQAYRAYIQGYPNGAFLGDAQARLDELTANQPTDAERQRYEAEERKVAGALVARRLVETRLAALGLEPGPVDGKFDDETRKSLRKFQETRGLPVTGYVDQQTMVRVLLGN